MRNSKKLLSLIACLSLLSSCNKNGPSESNTSNSNTIISTPTSNPTSIPEPEKEVNPFDYAETTSINDKLYLTSFNSSLTDEMKLKITELRIPSEINGKTLIGFGVSNAYPTILKGFDNLRKIYIPKTIQSFYYTTNNSVISNSSSFDYLPSLEEIELEIREDDNLIIPDVTLEDGTVRSSNCLLQKQISNNPSYQILCGWKDVIIPELDNLTSIRELAFTNKLSVTSVTIGRNIKSIGKSSFLRNPNLKEIILKDSNFKIDGNVLYDANGVIYAAWGDVIVPSSITKLTDSKYSSTTDSNFQNFYSVTTITIPEDSKLTSIGGSAFSYLPNLIDIKLLKSESKYKVEPNTNCLYDSETKEIIAGWGDVKVPESITELKPSCFTYDLSMKSIYIHDKVTSISGYQLFSGINTDRQLDDYLKIEISKDNEVISYVDNCIIMKEKDDGTEVNLISAYPDKEGNVKIPSNVTRISSDTFLYGNNLSLIKNIEFNEGLISIDTAQLFASGCKNITKLELPSTLQKVTTNSAFGYSSFRSLSGLEEVTIRGGNNQYFEIPEGTNCLIQKGATVDENKIILGWGNVVLPSKEVIKRCGKGLFYDNTSITSITWNRKDIIVTLNDEQFAGLGGVNSRLEAFNYVGTIEDIETTPINTSTPRYSLVYVLQLGKDYLQQTKVNFINDEGIITHTKLISELKDRASESKN